MVMRAYNYAMRALKYIVSAYKYSMKVYKFSKRTYTSAVRVYTLLICCLLSQNTFSQGIKDSVFRIEEIKVTADRIFMKEEAGMKETRIDTTVLLEKANLSLSELLSENTSVFIKSYGRGALATASFRGTAASHAQVNWNGMNINTPMAGMVDFSLIPVYIIDDMNLKHGTASIAGGSGGLGGSVNISNKAEWNGKPGVKYMQGAGSCNTFDEFVQLGAGNRQIRLKTRLYHNYSKNDYTFVNRGIGNIDPETGEIVHPLDTNDNAGYTRYGILQEVYYRPDHNNILSARWWGQQAGRTIPRVTSYEGPDNSNLNRQTDNDNKIVLDWKHHGKNNKLLMRSGYSVKKLGYSLRINIPGLGHVNSVFSESTQKSLLNSVSYTHNFKDAFSVECSFDVNVHDIISGDTVQKTGYEQQRVELSSFFALRKSFANRLNLNLMFRQYMTDNKIVPLVPFFGFDFRLIKETDLLLKGNIARNYHQPSLNDLYWQPGGNPDLLPEEGISYELGIEYQLTARNHGLRTEATMYRSDIDNWIIWIPGYKGYWEPQNIKRVLSQGIEFNAIVNGSFGKAGYKVAGTYAYTSSVNYGDPLVWGDESYGRQLVYIPLHSGNVMVNLSYRRFFITFQHNSYSERYTTSSNDISRRDWLYPYFMNDLMFGKEIQMKKLTASAEIKIYNLFNETYHSILYRPMPGRNYMFLLMLKF